MAAKAEPDCLKIDYVTTGSSREQAEPLAKLEQKGLKPVREADRRTLIRRVTFDLIGLEPR